MSDCRCTRGANDYKCFTHNENLKQNYFLKHFKRRQEMNVSVMNVGAIFHINNNVVKVDMFGEYIYNIRTNILPNVNM